jgi:DNA-binding transcriptional ArsR family regulator
MRDFHERIGRAVSRFVHEIAEIARDAALHALGPTLAADEAVVAKVYARLATSVRWPQGPRAPTESPRSVRSSRRSRAAMEALRGNVLAVIRANPGTSASAIAMLVGTTRAAIVGPLRHLLQAGKVRVKRRGKRGLRYYTVDAEA